ncbi:FecR family protein [Maribacter sp. 4G9]|uniref:FecR family protein n=1 Tax=Maribacter sp. 4G9 TaxID=1889777 RepID=UPI000C15DD9B|nr:FecR domain-containing protein [Maribacter sp. 4G9]PIB27961.1 hypothetical protein BFP75_06165 [Maribacter sp. 4G9]
MDKLENKILLKKWLNSSITSEELKVLKTSDDFADYEYIIDNAHKFKAPAFDLDDSYITIKNKIKSEKRKRQFANRSMLAVAASVVVIFGLYFSFFRTHVTTITADHNGFSVTLPDESSVILTQGSSIVYNKRSWKQQRDVTLNGEGFFKVEKGSSFAVHAKDAIITVLGTQFNVKEDNGLVVTCYEGKVSIMANNKNTILEAGKELNTGMGDAPLDVFISEPTWISNSLLFKSIPLNKVIENIEKQYGITLQISSAIDLSQNFTGKISSDNLEEALRALTVPLNLQFEITGDIVLIKE